MVNTSYVFLIYIAFLGVILAMYLHHKKKSQKTEDMVCPLKTSCEEVITSEYSKFMGIPVEMLGLFYYSLVAVAYGIMLVFPQFITSFFVFSVIAVSAAAVLFSAYLTFIQAFTLKKWCTWCVLSALLCVGIFFFAISGYELSLGQLLSQYSNLLLTGHMAGIALGLGAATTTDVFFFKFLKNYRIVKFEARVMEWLSEIIWFALALLALTGVALYIPQATVLNNSPKFLAKITIFGFLVINGSLLNLVMTPHLLDIEFSRKGEKRSSEETRKIRKTAFTMGAISVTSWYSVFIIAAMLGSHTLTYVQIMTIYAFLLAGAIIASLLMEKKYQKDARSSKRK